MGQSSIAYPDNLAQILKLSDRELSRELAFLAAAKLFDDLDARRWARRLKQEPIGTLGVLLAARLRGEIPSVRREIERLEGHGFRASSTLVASVLEEAGELPPGS